MKQVKTRRHTKIVCTLGPASNSPGIIRGMLKGGMDIVRLNLAYGTPEEHSRIISEVRSLSEQLKLPTGVLVDLPGLKKRTGDLEAIYGGHLKFAISHRVDFIALSFISSPKQVTDFIELLNNVNANIPVIVKIEKKEALELSSAIIEVSDSIMVARGDLAHEISIEKVPLAQKQLIREANGCGKPVVTATQMLESMVRSTTPTRAEATDVANAVLDGSDALMLSEETAVGSNPIKAVEMMSRIAVETETEYPYEQILRERLYGILPEVNDAMARSACQIAQQVQARGIITFTTGGTTALRLSKYRPKQFIIAVTPLEICKKRLSIAWGVLPIEKPEPANLEEVFDLAAKVAIETEIARKGDLVVITAGLPLRTPGSTNLVKVHCI